MEEAGNIIQEVYLLDLSMCDLILLLEERLVTNIYIRKLP